MYTGTDNEIITRILNGERQLYTTLIQRHQHFVFTIALRYASVREDAEEIAQDVFVKAFKGLPDFRAEAKFTTWLYAILHSTAITFLRKKKPDIVSLDDENVFTSANHQHSGFEANTIEHKSKLAMVTHAIQLLNPDDAKIILLFYKGEQSLEEIGKILEIAPNTAKVKLFRARQRLREKMEKHFSQSLSDLNYKTH